MPAFIGITLFVCGIIGAKEAMRILAMHSAIHIDLVGFIGAAAALFKANQEMAAIVSKSITSVLCATFIGLCVRSFIQARKTREAAAVAEPEPTE